jgi:hypothetical protein
MPNTDPESALQEIDLKELELIFAQHHTRMHIIAQLTSLSVALAGALLAAFLAFPLVLCKTPLMVIMMIPVPFFAFGLLVLREDLLMVTGDFYLYRLRRRILRRVGLEPNDMALSYLPEIKDAKLGRLSSLLSVLRYTPPFAVFVLSGIWLAWIHAEKCNDVASQWNVATIILALVDVGASFALASGMQRVKRLHVENEKLVPPRSVV